MVYTEKQLEKMKGPWIRTFSNQIVNPLELREDDIDIQDIAHHLALINRFVGALRHPVSVAQHSICVSRLVRAWLGPDYGLYGLLHDASEAYLGDVSKWLKGQPGMEFYRDAEEDAEAIIYRKYGLDPDWAQNAMKPGGPMELADRLMVRVEGELGFDIPELIPNNERYTAVSEPEWADVRQIIGPRMLAEMDWRSAKLNFLLEFKELTRVK